MSASKILDTKMAKIIMMGKEDKKVAKGLKSMRKIIGERKKNDRYDVRSRDCHETDAHVSYGKLSNGTSGGASNLIAQEDLELV